MSSSFFKGTTSTDIYTLSLHDALPIFPAARDRSRCGAPRDHHPEPRWDSGDSGRAGVVRRSAFSSASPRSPIEAARSEEHTSELQSRLHLVCRLLLEKKNLVQY